MRLALSIVIALVVTLALFWFMQYLIAGGDKDVLQPEPPLTVEIVRVKRDEQVQERKREPPRPPQQQDRPPPPPMDQMARAQPGTGTGISMPPIETGAGIGLGPMQEGDAIPVATIPPQYPIDAQRNGIEGWVRVEFTINPDGSVADPRVIDAYPRRGIFDREALRAISRWRFRARVEGGEPVITHGARYTIEFEMEASR